ncbi:hypothetical protein MKAN_00705 [Mycobacterium kansasii ATCC 12478]|uniref:Uncharacterized protein n=1 Tax=Mycobacterium kansasii ATCC 12478 TaxID=557599 RepID=U5WXP8_MYCKA|nr:hypothetical protein MKAN_00705 [Mycobacterium kansasii ATCC 12478]
MTLGTGAGVNRREPLTVPRVAPSLLGAMPFG